MTRYTSKSKNILHLAVTSAKIYLATVVRDCPKDQNPRRGLHSDNFQYVDRNACICFNNHLLYPFRIFANMMTVQRAQLRLGVTDDFTTKPS